MNVFDHNIAVIESRVWFFYEKYEKGGTHYSLEDNTEGEYHKKICPNSKSKSPNTFNCRSHRHLCTYFQCSFNETLSIIYYHIY